MNESKVNALIDEQIAQLEKEKAEVQKKLDELKKLETEAAPKDVWPKDGDEYWYIDSIGDCLHNTWYDAPVDRRHAAIGNVFRTEEDAEAAVQRLKDLATVKKDAKGFKPNWSDRYQAKHSIYYNYIYNVFDVSTTWTTTWTARYTVLYFQTEVDAEESIRNHKAEWLRLLGVTQ